MDKHKCWVKNAIKKKLKVEVGLKLEPKSGSNMDKHKCWVKNAIKKVES